MNKNNVVDLKGRDTITDALTQAGIKGSVPLFSLIFLLFSYVLYGSIIWLES